MIITLIAVGILLLGIVFKIISKVKVGVIR